MALEYLERGLELFEQAGDTRGIAGSLDDIGQVLWLLGALRRGARPLGGGAGDAAAPRRRRVDRGVAGQHRQHRAPPRPLRRGRGLLSRGARAARARSAIGPASPQCDNGLGVLAFQRGDIDGAHAHLGGGARRGRAHRRAAAAGAAACRTSARRRALGSQRGEARTRFDAALALARDLDDKRILSRDRAPPRPARCSRAATPRARSSTASAALEIAETAGIRVDVGRALVALGRGARRDAVRRHRPRRAAAPRSFFERGVTLFREIGNEAELAVGARALRQVSRRARRRRRGQAAADRGGGHLPRLGHARRRRAAARDRRAVTRRAATRATAVVGRRVRRSPAARRAPRHRRRRRRAPTATAATIGAAAPGRRTPPAPPRRRSARHRRRTRPISVCLDRRRARRSVTPAPGLAAVDEAAVAALRGWSWFVVSNDARPCFDVTRRSRRARRRATSSVRRRAASSRTLTHGPAAAAAAVADRDERRQDRRRRLQGLRRRRRRRADRCGRWRRSSAATTRSTAALRASTWDVIVRTAGAGALLLRRADAHRSHAHGRAAGRRRAGGAVSDRHRACGRARHVDRHAAQADRRAAAPVGPLKIALARAAVHDLVVIYRLCAGPDGAVARLEPIKPVPGDDARFLEVLRAWRFALSGPPGVGFCEPTVRIHRDATR